jgi:hypothetical protein
LGDFWKKEVWHGLGMFGTVTHRELDKPTVMMAIHGVLILLGLVCAGVGVWSGYWQVLGAGLSAMFLVPIAAVAFRSSRVTRKVPWIRGVLLYQFYFLARIRALSHIIWSTVRSPS